MKFGYVLITEHPTGDVDNAQGKDLITLVLLWFAGLFLWSG